MTTIKINNPLQLIKELEMNRGSEDINKRIERIKQQIEFKKIEIIDLQLQLAREIDRKQNETKNKKNLHYLMGRNLWS